MKADSPTTLRWILTNKWGDPDIHSQALQLIDDIVGYPRASQPDKNDDSLAPSLAGKKVALVVGHNARQKGAFIAGEIDQFEYDFHNQVVTHLIADGIQGVELKRFNREYSGSYSNEIRAVYKQVNEWKPDMVVELHFNGGGGNYTTMLAGKGRKRSQAIAQVFQNEFVNVLGFKDRAIIVRESSDRGGRSLFASEAPLVLTEPFFGDHADHQRSVSELGHGGIATIYKIAIAEALHELATTTNQ